MVQVPNCQHQGAPQGQNKSQSLKQKEKEEEKEKEKKDVWHWQRRFGISFMGATCILSSAAHPTNAHSLEMWHYLDMSRLSHGIRFIAKKQKNLANTVNYLGNIRGIVFSVRHSSTTLSRQT